MPEIGQLAPQQLLEEAYKLIAKDKAKLSGTNYAPYRGATVSPMSTLTQKARGYQNYFANKPAPYSNKINTVLNKSNEALPQGNIQDLLNTMRESQSMSNENTLMGQLKNNFRSSYTPEREAGYKALTNGDIGRSGQELSGKLQDINKAASNLEGAKNSQIVKILQELQQGKQLRREGLIDTQERFGNQKHTHGNKVIEADRARFNQEANAPQERLKMLTQALEPHRQNFGSGQMHPDLENPAAQEIISALRAYGIDPTKPTEQWENARTEPSRYKGQMVAGLTPEMESSYNLAERISPSYKDVHHAQRKDIVRGLTGNETTAGKALRNVPAAMQGRIAQLETEASERLGKDMAVINNKYIKLGQYNSPQHIREGEERAQEINRAMMGQRNSYLDEALRNQISMQHESEIGNIRKARQLGEAGHQEFGKMMGDVHKLNKLGSTKWENEQDELDQLYKNYQQENLWEWPHMRNATMNQNGGMFGSNNAGGLGLNALANTHAAYSELNKETPQNLAPITNQPQYNSAMQQQQAKIKNATAERERQEMNVQREKERLQQQQQMANNYEKHKASQMQNRHMAFNALPRLYKDSMLLKWTGNYPNTGPDPMAADYKQYMTYAPQMGENPNKPESWRKYSNKNW